MKNSILIILGILVIVSCRKNDDDQIGEACDWKAEIFAPDGFQVRSIGEIVFNGNVKSFQFISDDIGYAMLSNNAGGYVEVFKTTDGGQTWSNLDIGINQYPRNMLFKDENIGIITVHDVTGCPPPNCLNKCVILKTENGGMDWEEVEFDDLKGVLHHPTYDGNGNLYAILKLDEQSTLLKSTDNGAYWYELFSSEALDFKVLTYSFEIYNDEIFLSGKDGKILVVDTNGQFIKTIDIENSPIWDVEIMDHNNLTVVLSGKVIKSADGGETWEVIYEGSARMIGFASFDKGLMMLQRSICPTDVYQVNDLIASTSDGGYSWVEAEETTTNLQLKYSNSQKMSDGVWYFMIGNKLFEIKEN